MNCPICNGNAYPRKKKTGFKCVKGHKWTPETLQKNNSSQQALTRASTETPKKEKSNKELILGNWRTQQISVLGLKFDYKVTVKKDGSLELTAKYKNGLAQAIMAVWDMKLTGSWEMPSETKLSIEINKVSSYPTKLGSVDI
jgi:hypothetical protein